MILQNSLERRCIFDKLLQFFTFSAMSLKDVGIDPDR
jgi:hypothetical protein